jgi:REP element-mobilizing transposase RayT
MPRKNLIRSSSHPYHVTTRANNKEWFYIPTPDVWHYCQNLLDEGEKRFLVKIDAFVLMNNHYHMLIHTPEANLDKFMHFFNKRLSDKISSSAKRINRIFGSGYRWNLIQNQGYYYTVLRYIYQNPMRAQLVSSIKEYPFTDYYKQKHHHQFEKWLNQLLNEEAKDQTKKMLRRYQI